MSNGKSNGTGPRHSGSNGSAGSGSAHPNGQVGSLNCAEFFRNPYGMYEDESIETAIEASPGIMAEAVGEGEARNLLYRVLLEMDQPGLFCFSHFCLGIVHHQLNSAAHNSAFHWHISASTQFFTRNFNL